MKTIGIFGAAFDPLHLGHLALARMALAANKVDEVWLMPSPERWDKRPVASAAQRLAWAELAALSERSKGWAVEASDFELLLGEFRGTYRLLKELTRHPASKNLRFKLLIGQDSLDSMYAWRDAFTNEVNGERLLNEFCVVVGARGHALGRVPTWAEALAHQIEFLQPFTEKANLLADLGDATELASLASSTIKARLKNGDVFRFSLVEIERQIAASRIY